MQWEGRVTKWEKKNGSIYVNSSVTFPFGMFEVWKMHMATLEILFYVYSIILLFALNDKNSFLFKWVIPYESRKWYKNKTKKKPRKKNH